MLFCNDEWKCPLGGTGRYIHPGAAHFRGSMSNVCSFQRIHDGHGSFGENSSGKMKWNATLFIIYIHELASISILHSWLLRSIVANIIISASSLLLTFWMWHTPKIHWRDHAMPNDAELGFKYTDCEWYICSRWPLWNLLSSLLNLQMDQSSAPWAGNDLLQVFYWYYGRYTILPELRLFCCSACLLWQPFMLDTFHIISVTQN